MEGWGWSGGVNVHLHGYSTLCQLLSGASYNLTDHVSQTSWQWGDVGRGYGVERTGWAFVRGGAGQGSDAANHKTYATLRKRILAASICATHTRTRIRVFTHKSLALTNHTFSFSDQAWFAHVFKCLNKSDHFFFFRPLCCCYSCIS